MYISVEALNALLIEIVKDISSKPSIDAIHNIVDNYLNNNIETTDLKDAILEIINENSEEINLTVTDEQIETVVEEYLKEHPVDSSTTIVSNKKYKGAKGNKQPIITFTDDDGKLASYTIWKSLHESHGVVANLGIPFTPIGSDGNMTWTQLDELAQLGFEITSHGYNHTNYQTISEGSRRYSCEKQAIREVNALREHGYWHEDGNNVIILPNNYTDINTNKAYRKYYDHVIGESNTVYSTPLPFKIGRKFMDASGVKLSSLKALIDKCYQTGGWLLIGFHGWEQNTDIKIGYLKETIEYIQSLKIPIMTSYEALQVKGNIVDSGIYDNDGNFQSRLKIANDGNVINDLYHDDSSIIECTNVSFDVNELLFDTLEPRKLVMSITPSDTTGNIVWASSNKKIATVDQEGNVTPIADGTAIIYGSCANPYAECNVTIQLKCTSIDLSADNFTFNSTDYQTVTATLYPEGCQQQVVYATSDESIATISDKGVIRPVNDGTCTISVTCGDIVKTITVTITGLADLEYVLPEYNTETYKYYALIKDENSTSDIKYMFVASKKDLTRKWSQSVSGVTAIRYSNDAVFYAQKYTSQDGKIWTKVSSADVNPNYGLYVKEFTDSQYTIDTNCSYTEKLS